ncbi:Cytochrome b245, heavy chain [Parasponia andersonii]|uniref:ferric-chelate reductase (NADH) n=1 Tax=Parasponia andersonii TaxID=3476 RepID=A0A2P5CAU5_PARAD|nr:Cytochrome b245, heavy chain [Parasponia andersonii]
MVVFVGYILIWFMMPTKTFYLQWLPDIHAKTDSTYFGQQGANILIYTFPILFIATLSCLYLHIRKKMDDNNTERRENVYWKSWSRPVLVKGPLGIVSWMELSFLAMFITLLVWSFCSYLHSMFANINQQAAQMRLSLWEAKLESSALMLGLVGNICLAFLFFPVTRGSSILQLIGLTSESSIKYHIWLGHIAMTLFTAHGLCYIIFSAKTNQISQMLKWNQVGISNVAGEVALVSGLIMWGTSFHAIRRKIFELFFYTHHLYVVFVVFFVLHVGSSYSCVMLPGFYLFLIDRYLRFLQSQQKIRVVSARVLPCQVVELNFSKCPGLSYSPRSNVFLNVPGISKLQWHPFTVTSSSNLEPEKLSVVIKSEGSWSQNLYDRLSSSPRMDRMEISIEGPYGPSSTEFLRHETLVMISGGSGITPFISIIRELLFIANKATSKTPSVLLICAFKKSEDLTMLELILPASGTNFDISRLQLQIEAYVTREEEPPTETLKLPQTEVWFKPNSSDLPVYAILGQNSWLWLALIVAASFLVFLVLMGVLTRYYIYPIAHRIDVMYSFSSKSALNMLFICVSIATATTAGFLTNRKQQRVAYKTRQIQNMNAPTPSTSPSAWFHNTAAERELESLPHQSLVRATTVRHGTRPDLKKILMVRQSSSAGVLVSGPRTMRQEVAAICSSGSANNLHFQSSSFSW